jgi:hypothetical protein
MNEIPTPQEVAATLPQSDMGIIIHDHYLCPIYGLPLAVTLSFHACGSPFGEVLFARETPPDDAPRSAYRRLYSRPAIAANTKGSASNLLPCHFETHVGEAQDICSNHVWLGRIRHQHNLHTDGHFSGRAGDGAICWSCWIA